MSERMIGRYLVKAELGRGGMATVYRAYDPRFKREVAIKILPREFLHDPRFLERFTREAETIAALEHPAIVPVYDFGEQDGQPYLVMRLMTGGSLADRLQQGPIPLLEAARIFSRLAPALDKAHSLGIIHRDLKPGNILFDAEGDPYISDFGIAKLSEATASLTGDRILGTPAYMSPEQARGQRDLDGRSDIYALGAIVFQMLTGRLPYEADTPMALAIKHLTEPTPRILEARPDLPPACEDVIQKAMAKDRTQRFSSVNGLAEALATTVISRPPAEVTAALASTEQLRPPLHLGRRAWIAAGASALAILALGTVLWLRPGRDKSAKGGLAPTLIGLASTPVASETPTKQAPSPTVPPTIKPTSTTHATPTPTPPPAWVSDFAEPILAAIAGREPDFQDDFSAKAGGWEIVWPWLCSEMKYVDAELILSECKMRRGIWYTDFVAEMDARHLEAGQPDWDFAFRCEDPSCSNGNAYKLEFYSDGRVRASVREFGSDQKWPSIADIRLSGASGPGPNTNHMLVIVKDQEIALLVNSQPVFRVEVEPRWLNGGMAWGANGTVAFDNIRIWDISDISLAPTP